VRVLVLGGDGFLGWPTVLHLAAAGFEVGIFDSLARRDLDRELGTSSLVPIESLMNRIDAWHDAHDEWLHLYRGDTTRAGDLERALVQFGPDAVIHLAEQRSAPYSMLGSRQAAYTQRVNVIGTLNLIHAVHAVNPNIHVIKLGSLGEYGTPNLDIEEGWLDVTHKGRTDRVLYPKRPGSWYHLSKVHDSHNLEFACRAWNLRVTDLNQGVVYGVDTDQTQRHPDLATRFDYDAIFGTALNRFAVQAALGVELSVYGDGSQIRGFINLRDAVRCLELACLNPAEPGEFRVFNQLTQSISILDVAEAVASRVPGATVAHFVSDRVEEMGHHYRVTHTGLEALGLEPHYLTNEVIDGILATARRHLDRVNQAVIYPRLGGWHRD